MNSSSSSSGAATGATTLSCRRVEGEQPRELGGPPKVLPTESLERWNSADWAPSRTMYRRCKLLPIEVPLVCEHDMSRPLGRIDRLFKVDCVDDPWHVAVATLDAAPPDGAEQDPAPHVRRVDVAACAAPYRRRRPPRGKTYIATIRATMITAAMATIETVEAATITSFSLPVVLVPKPKSDSRRLTAHVLLRLAATAEEASREGRTGFASRTDHAEALLRQGTHPRREPRFADAQLRARVPL